MIPILMAHVTARAHLHPEEAILLLVGVVVLILGGTRLARAIARR